MRSAWISAHLPNTSALEVEWLDELLNSVMHSNNPALIPSLPAPHLPRSPSPRKLGLFTPVHPWPSSAWARSRVRRSPPTRRGTMHTSRRHPHPHPHLRSERERGDPTHTHSSHRHGEYCLCRYVSTCTHIPSPTRAGPPPNRENEPVHSSPACSFPYPARTHLPLPGSLPDFP